MVHPILDKNYLILLYLFEYLDMLVENVCYVYKINQKS